METLVKSLTSIFTKQLSLDQDKEQIIAYSLRLVISSIIGYLAIILIAYPLNILHITIPMAIAHSVLRVCSGGAHASTSTHCFIIGSLIFSALGLIVKWLLPIYNFMYISVSSAFIFIIAILIIKKYAPADVPDKPIKAKAQREKLKKLSLWVVIIWYLVIKLSLLFTGDRYATFIIATGWGILWQSFTLTKAGYKFTEFLDSLLFNIKISRRYDNV
jgi:accessory gene regulator B